MSGLYVEIDFSELNKAIATYAVATGKELSDVLKDESRLLVKEVINLTPPAGGGVTGAAAKRRGEAAVERDIGGLFVGRRIKGRRQITKVFGRTPKKRVFVKTKELHPDVRAIYDVRSAKDRFQGKFITRGQKAAFYVDNSKLVALRTAQKKKVGKLASGWVPALKALDSSGASWIERHLATGTRGTAHLDKADELNPNFEAECQVKGDIAYELQRRLRSAVEIRKNKMLRRLPHVMAAVARKAGFET